MKFLQSKITKRYLVITLVVLLSTLGLLYFLTVWVMNSSLQQQIEQRNDLIARTLSKRIGFLLEKISNDLRSVANLLVLTPQEEKGIYLSEMQRLVSSDPLYFYLQAYDQYGRTIVKILDIQLSDPYEVTQIQERLQWSKSEYISNGFVLPNGRKTIAVAYPVLDKEGNFLGSIIAFLNLNTISDYLQDLRIGQEGVNAVIDRNGMILAYSGDPSQATGTLADHPVGEFLSKERYGLWEGKLFNQDMLVAYRPLSVGGFGLIVAEPLHQSMEPSNHVKALLFRGFLVVVLIAIGLSLFGTSQVVRPILKLTRQVKEYKEQKRKQFEPIKTRDEIQDLSIVLGQMARELTEKERRMFYILESIPYCVITTNKDGRITTFNKGAEELTLFRREEVIGKYIIELPFKEKKEEYVAWKTLREGKAFDEIESYILDKEGNRHEVIIYSSLFPGEENEIIGAIIVIRDVSELKKLEGYVKQSERLASLGQLAAGIAHEIRNPLSIIQAAAEAIRLEVEDNKADMAPVYELSEDILESTGRMNNILTNFLKLSKDEKESKKTNIELTGILNELLHLLRNKWIDQGIDVICRYDVQEAWVYGDKNRLTQVFFNIMLNSLQAMETGGTLTVSVLDKIQNWEIAIQDTGKGIPASKLQWIFNPFFSTKREGTGLGLSISHEIVMQHNGKIFATSEEGVGTVLYVQIPKAEGGM